MAAQCLIGDSPARIVKYMADGAWSIRDSSDADIDEVAKTYGYWVEHGLGSFELSAPPPSAIAERRAAIMADGFPYLVAADPAGRLLGFAYASWYRTRPAYRFACEDSVYVAPGILPAIGWKHERWVDTVLMTRPLGAGNRSPPDASQP